MTADALTLNTSRASSSISGDSSAAWLQSTPSITLCTAASPSSGPTAGTRVIDYLLSRGRVRRLSHPLNSGSTTFEDTSGYNMPTSNVNGIRLFYELSGTGDVPLVLVHGAWDSHQAWELVVPRLAESFRVLTYDRRGHSQSERPAGQGSIHEDVADLAALIEHLDLEPAWVAGHSSGASITLRLAVEHADLLRGVIVHEPALFALLADDPSLAPMLEEIRERVGAVVDRMASEDHAGAAEQFIETVALGPGAWAQLPPEFQQTLIENAPTFLDDANDPEHLAFDLERIIPFSRPVLLTKGEQSPPPFAPVAAKIADVLPAAAVHTFPGAGHIPHVTHPDAYIEATMDFIHENPT